MSGLVTNAERLSQDQRTVTVRREPLTLPTYEPAPPSRFPAFLGSRVYQGSSGSVYPLPFHERIAPDPVDRTWDAIHLENSWIELTVLPELGGRIYAATDRTTGYDFFYRNPVIKPALVGLAGPWISGGVELNWPQHHRPGTYLPTEALVEHGADGSVTVWCSDHDPFTRMKGMHGVCLHPDRAVIELKVRLHNRTPLTQTFLWWANVAARSHDDYQSFFPPDVHYVADHANRATVSFPRAQGTYYGVDYPERRRTQEARGRNAGEPDADRLDWYRNIPVPTSYMVLQTNHGFFGGYDHAEGAGFVHWADPAISPGKKQWTWGNSPFGHAWDRNLTDDGSHYVELMAGVYTNNQPDFAYLAPGETKAFTQFWYPYSQLGPVQQATPEAALSLRAEAGGVTAGVAVTRPREGLRVVLDGPGGQVGSWEVDLDPARPFTAHVDGDLDPDDLHLTLVEQGGEIVADLHPRPVAGSPEVPPPAREPVAPEQMTSLDELYVTGVHLAQYRHATRSPETWWLAALERDPGDSRCNTAMGERLLRRGRYASAQQHLARAVARLTSLNGTPRDGEAHYLLGLVLLRRSRLAADGGDAPLREEGRAALERAAWDSRWHAPATFELGRDAAWHGDLATAIRLLGDVIRVEPEHLAARAALVTLLRRTGHQERAGHELGVLLTIDPLDVWGRHLRDGAVDSDAQHHLDLARDYAALGDHDAALQALDQAETAPTAAGATHVGPLVRYARASYLREAGHPQEEVRAAQRQATAADMQWCLPVTLDDVDALQLAIDADPHDGTARALLAAWRYAHGDVHEAAELWTAARTISPADPGVLRNLGLLAYNHQEDPDEAWRCYVAAFDAAPDDPQLLHEIDELAQRRGEAVANRLARLEAHHELVIQRDDLVVSLVSLLVDVGRGQEAVSLLGGRRFQPWEGGEGKVLGAWEDAQLALHAAALSRGDHESAVEHAQAALDPPVNLGEARHPLANTSRLLLALGDALAAAGDETGASAAWRAAADESGDFQQMAATPASDLTYYSVLAARRLDDDERAGQLIDALRAHVATLESTTPTVDFFATSLPQTLLFAEDPQDRRRRDVTHLRGQLERLTRLDQHGPTSTTRKER